MTFQSVSLKRPVRLVACSTLLLLTMTLGTAAPVPVLAGDIAAESTDTGAGAITILDLRRAETSYALLRQDDRTVFVGDQKALAQARRYQARADKKLAGRAAQAEAATDYLWIRHAYQHYVIDDAQLLAEVLTLWRAVEPHELEMTQLSEEMQIYTGELEAQAAVLAAAIDSGDTVSRTAIETFERLSAPLQAKIEPLGERMEAVGQQIETGSEAAHQRTLALIHSSIASGVAKPVPAR